MPNNPNKIVSKTLEPIPELACTLLQMTDDYIFLSKNSGIHSVAHDASEKNSVANWLLSVDPQLNALNPLECGLAHRLDFETSGVMVAARNTSALIHLQKLFRERNIIKKYVCLVTSTPPPVGVYEAFARNHPRSKKRVVMTADAKKKSQRIMTEVLPPSPALRAPSPKGRGQGEGTPHLLHIRLITGFRHQIRAHLEFLGCPIVGDKIYHGATAPRLMLHAEELEFKDTHGKILVASCAPNF